MNRPIERRTVAAEAAEILRQRILSGDLKAGQPIRQEQIAQELGVSRIPLREALKQLEAEGFVSIEPHKGAVVATISADEVAELFALRQRLETWLLGEAIPRMTEADHAAVAKILVESEAPKDLAHWGEINWRLHEALYRAAGRPVTLKFLKRIHDSLDRYIRLQITLTRDWDRAHRDHRDLCTLALKGDAAAATGLLERHILATAEALATALAPKGT
jgi:DNA-binding GntR family transcriptional regulator